MESTFKFYLVGLHIFEINRIAKICLEILRKFVVQDIGCLYLSRGLDLCLIGFVDYTFTCITYLQLFYCNWEILFDEERIRIGGEN